MDEHLAIRIIKQKINESKNTKEYHQREIANLETEIEKSKKQIANSEIHIIVMEEALKVLQKAFH